MRFHLHQTPKFSATKLQPAPEGCNEYSHATTLLSEAAQRIRLQGSEIIRSIFGALGERGHPATGVKLPTESEAAGFLDLLVESLRNGPLTLTPFNDRERLKIAQHFGTTAELLAGWEVFLRQLPKVTPAKLILPDHLLLERRTEQTLDLLRWQAAAQALGTQGSTPVAAVVEAMRRSQQCEAEPGSQGTDPWASLRSRLEDFLVAFRQWLRHGSEAEIHLNLCRYWGEELAPAFDLSLPEWSFLFAALENAIAAPLGPASHRALTPFFATLERIAPRLAFAGAFYRRFSELEAVVEPQVGRLAFDWRECTRELLGEILWDDPLVGSSLRWRLAWGDPVLGKTTAEDFRHLGLLVVNLSRPLGERHWLDRLENAFHEIAATLDSTQRQAELQPSMAKAVNLTAANLREGRDAFRQDGFLEEDLQLLLDGASACQRASRDVPTARRHFRAWFAGIFFLRRNHDLWRNANTITGALRTTLQRLQATLAESKAGDLAGELLAEVPALQAEADWLRRVWPETGATPVGPSVAVPLLHRVVVEKFRVGSRRAPVAALEWLLSPAGLPVGVLEEVPGAVEALAANVPSGNALAEPEFAAVWENVRAGLPATMAGWQIWMQAAGISAEVSRRVYTTLPEYLEKTGPEGMRACARDLALTLCRASLALRPVVPDPAEYLSEWWNGLINAYLKTRPARLFEVTRAALCEVTAEMTSPAAATVMDALVGPLYLEAMANACEPPAASATEGSADTPELAPLNLRVPLWARVRAQPELGVAALESKFLMFFQQAVGQMMASPGLPKRKAVPAGQVDALARGLAAGACAYISGSGLDNQTTAWWRKAVVTLGNGGKTLRNLLYRLPRQVNRPLVPTLTGSLLLLGFLDELAEFHGRCVAGLALESKAAALAQCLHAQVDGHLPAIEVKKWLQGLALAWSNLPTDAALLQAHRLTVELFAGPAFMSAGLTPELSLANLCGLATEELVFLVPTETCVKLQKGFADLAHLPVGHLAVSVAVRRKLRAEADPLFTPDPAVETSWRELVGLLPILAGIAASPAGQSAAGSLRAALCESLSLLDEPEFGEQAASLPTALRAWFPDLPLTPTITAVENLTQTWKYLKALRPCILKAAILAANLADRLPPSEPDGPAESVVADHEEISRLLLFTGLAAVREGGSIRDKSAAAMAFPPYVSGGSGERLVGASAMDLARWGTLLENVLGQCYPGLEGGVGALLNAIGRLRDHRATLSSEWWGCLEVNARSARRGLFGLGGGAELNAEQTHLLPDAREIVRRSALEQSHLSLGGVFPEVATWYAAQVLSMTDEIGLEIHTGFLQNLTDQTSHQSAIIKHLANTLPRRYAANRIENRQRYFIDHLIEVLGRQLSMTRKDSKLMTTGMEGEQGPQARLSRACVQPLRAVCHEVATGETLWHERWSSSLLAGTWHCSLPTFRQAVSKTAQAILGRQAAALEKVLS